MNLVAALLVDLERSPLGTRSRLSDNLLGKPVLRRTLERVSRTTTLSSIHVLCPVRQANQVRPLLDGLDVKLETHDAGPPSYQMLVQASRLWGLDGWRGGIGSLCAFDEDFHAPLVHGLARQTGADGVMSIPAAAPVIDPELLDAMVRHFQDHHDQAKLTIVQAPPGLGALIIDQHVLEELTSANLPPGALLMYQPGNPMPDIAGKEACYRPPADVVESKGRLLCDTQRSMDRIVRLLESGGDSWDTGKIARWLSSVEAKRVADVPEEIEVELTTEHPFTTSQLRPRGADVGRRGPIKMEAVRAVADWIGEADDVRIVLGGFGEPVCHPDFREICRIFRDAGAAAIAVRTSVALDDPAATSAFIEAPIDVLEVTLDAACEDTYRRVHGVDEYGNVLSRLERLLARRADEQRVLPLIVPSMIKANETLNDLEPFVDMWQQRLGTLVVTGYSHCAMQRPLRTVTNMAPPLRAPCRRVFSRALILADGRMTTCDQDFAGKQTVGRVDETPVRELWRHDDLAGIRANDHPKMPLCPKCDEWHRP